MDIGIIIVNYKTAALTVECLSALSDELGSVEFKTIVVDNDSQDGSDSEISSAIDKHNWSKWASLVCSGKNGGFSYGNNVAIRQFLSLPEPPKYIYLLNSDTVVKPGAVYTLMAFMDERPKAGITGSRLETEDGTGRNSCFQFHNFLTECANGFSLSLVSKMLSKWVHPAVVPDSPCLKDWVAGASMMIRTDVFYKVGLMDESYFLYYEEMDFCLQVHKGGWECWFVPESRVLHLEGQSTGVNNKSIAPRRRPKYWFESRRRYFVKNFGKLHAMTADIVWLLGMLTWKLRNIIQRKESKYPPHFFMDACVNSVLFQGFDIKKTQNKLETE
jgi:N-acetylglucosaminyl-diphospho-decaprenol L-rhamnosyltransferase